MDINDHNEVLIQRPRQSCIWCEALGYERVPLDAGVALNSADWVIGRRGERPALWRGGDDVVELALPEPIPPQIVLSASGLDLNDPGVVSVRVEFGMPSEIRAIVWLSPLEPRVLPSLPMSPSPDVLSGVALNNHNWVLVQHDDSSRVDGRLWHESFVYAATIVGPESERTQVMDINDANWVVGFALATLATPSPRPVVWKPPEGRRCSQQPTQSRGRSTTRDGSWDIRTSC